MTEVTERSEEVCPLSALAQAESNQMERLQGQRDRVNFEGIVTTRKSAWVQRSVYSVG